MRRPCGSWRSPGTGRNSHARLSNKTERRATGPAPYRLTFESVAGEDGAIQVDADLSAPWMSENRPTIIPLMVVDAAADVERGRKSYATEAWLEAYEFLLRRSGECPSSPCGLNGSAQHLA